MHVYFLYYKCDVYRVIWNKSAIRKQRDGAVTSLHLWCTMLLLRLLMVCHVIITYTLYLVPFLRSRGVSITTNNTTTKIT
mgnify:CR=1